MTIHLFHIIRKRLYLLMILGFCVFCTACENTSQAVPDSEENEAFCYSMRFQELPDPDEALRESSILEGHKNCLIRESRRFYQDGRIYRLLFLTEETEGSSFFIHCLQIFYEDSWSWEQFILSDIEWMENSPTGISGLVGATQAGVFLQITEYTVDGDDKYLGYFDGANAELLMPWPEEIEEASVYRDREQNIYFISTAENAVYAYNNDGEQQKRTALDCFLLGGLCHPKTGDMLWYGGNSEGAHLWQDLNRPSSYELIKAVEPYAFQIAYAPDGTLYYADAASIWIQGEQQIFSFAEHGYRLEDLYHFQVQENGDIQCYVFLDNCLCLLELQRMDADTAPIQQEMILSYSGSDIFLEQIVTRFNRQNPQYHITLSELTDSLQLQMEMTAGEGPDLLQLDPSSAESYARQGYLQSMEGIIQDTAPFWDAALETGRINDIPYGIPYSCTMVFPVFSRQLVGDRQSWTTEEMIQCITESNTEILIRNYSAYNILISCGFYDNANTTYIDWEKGESHLSEQPFMELLEFAKEYADPQEYNASDVFSLFQEGHIAGEPVNFYNLGLMDRTADLFSGNASYIGYPNSTGEKGVFVSTDCLYMNQASDKIDGVTEFIRFMLSEEAQRRCIAYGDFCYLLPVRLSTISYLIELEQEKADNPVSPADGYLAWQEDGLDEAQLQQLYELMEQAKPYKFHVTEIEDILYEELEPYFAGARSITDTVTILDNRVQLYLNERGSQ